MIRAAPDQAIETEYSYLSLRSDLNKELRQYAAWTGEKIEHVAVRLGYTAWSLIGSRSVICDFHNKTTVLRRRAAV